ncbi:MAG: DUF1207 domain-containing protein, partial [Maioricimonas sp. JB049]
MLPALRGYALATVLVLSGATAWGQSGIPDWVSAETFSTSSLLTATDPLPALTDALAQDRHQAEPTGGLLLNDQHLTPTTVRGQCPDANCVWGWRLLPGDVLYSSYLASPIAPRMQSGLLYERDKGWLWELEAGARVGIVRWGSPQGAYPEGWQLDVWGAAFPRLNFENNMDLDAADFRVGVPLTYRRGPWQAKLEIAHLSSHLGDEFLLRNPGFNRLNYLRDTIALGGGYFVNPDLRVYGEAEVAFNNDGGSEPLHFQFGFDYSPIYPWGPAPIYGAPFAAVNVQLREEVDFGGGINIVAGWQFRSPETGHLFRAGLQYYNGKS